MLGTFAYDERVQGLHYNPASQITTILRQLTATSAQINKADCLL
jgi:hypothetical protein